MASLVKRLAGHMGYELKKKYGTLPPLDFLETLLLGVPAVAGRLNVVQVGANDGRHSDPIYNGAIINFESKHLIGQRMAKLQAFLSGLGDTLYQWNKIGTVALSLSDTAGARVQGPGQG